MPIEARDGLLEKDLIAFDGTQFQVLALPPKPIFEKPPASFLHSAKRQRNARISQLDTAIPLGRERWSKRT
jgi:hypothetical protein